MAFQDHFSATAGTYRRARPHYPDALAAHLAAVAPGRRLALDVATGSGQAAVGLARHFERVLASDASRAQLGEAVRHERIAYLCHLAERMPVAGGVVDLVAVAQAAHWMDLDAFYAEARRVLRPGGVVAMWTYGRPRLDPACDAAIDAFHDGRVGRYWPPERRHVDEGYRSLPFPFEPVAAPGFQIALDWTLAEFLAYLSSWSAVARCSAAEGVDPVAGFAGSLTDLWGGSSRRTVRWPLHLLLGRTGPI